MNCNKARKLKMNLIIVMLSAVEVLTGITLSYLNFKRKLPIKEGFIVTDIIPVTCGLLIGNGVIDFIIFLR